MAEHNNPHKKRMPTGMYVGSAWIGFAILMFLCWMMTLLRGPALVQGGAGEAANFQIILNLIALFGFGLPMVIGIVMLKRAGRQVRQSQQEDQIDV